MDDNRSLSYFFLGLGVGVAVGMIFAPQAGTDTRTLIKSRASEGGDYIRRRGSQLREGAGDLIDKGRDIVSRQKDTVAGAMEAGRQAYRDVSGAPGQTGSEPITPTEGI